VGPGTSIRHSPDPATPPPLRCPDDEADCGGAVFGGGRRPSSPLAYYPVAVYLATVQVSMPAPPRPLCPPPGRATCGHLMPVHPLPIETLECWRRREMQSHWCLETRPKCIQNKSTKCVQHGSSMGTQLRRFVTSAEQGIHACCILTLVDYGLVAIACFQWDAYLFIQLDLHILFCYIR
jgi:hypothetical protein